MMYFNKKKNLIASICLVWLVAFGISSCNLLDDGIAEPYFTPDFVLPLARGSVTLANLTEENPTLISDKDKVKNPIPDCAPLLGPAKTFSLIYIKLLLSKSFPRKSQSALVKSIMVESDAPEAIVSIV